MNRIPLQQAMAELKQLFVDNGVKFKTDALHDTSGENTSWISGSTFMIDKRHLERLPVIELLQEYFSDKCILNGGCSIEAITLCWTNVTLYDTEHPLTK
jgi:hypothetical protein